MDVIIPLRDGGSENNDQETRLLLRSLAANVADLGRVIIVTARRPAWASSSVTWVECQDIFERNKDGNIIRKILMGLTAVRSDWFAWTCDDFALLRPVRLDEWPVLYNWRGPEEFRWALDSNGKLVIDKQGRRQPTRNRWRQRMVATFDYLARHRCVYLAHNYDTHTLQRYPVAPLVDALEGVPWEDWHGIGLAVNTLFRGLLAKCSPLPETDQRQLTFAYEKPYASVPKNTWAISYNDTGFQNGALRFLAPRFKLPCVFESPTFAEVPHA